MSADNQVSEMVTRREAANILEVSIHKIRTLVWQGHLEELELPEEQVKSYRIQYRREDILRIKRTPGLVNPRGVKLTPEREMVDRVFKYFGRGVTDLQLIQRRTKATPAEITELWRQWNIRDVDQLAHERKIEEIRKSGQRERKEIVRTIRQITGFSRESAHVVGASRPAPAPVKRRRGRPRTCRVEAQVPEK